MSEIEKLMQNAGIDLFPSCHNCNRLDEYWNNGSYNETCKDDKSIYECKKAILKYPEFTAEKQLSLIKWLGKLAGKLEISSNYNDTQYLLYFYLNRKTRDEILPNISTGRSENFEESLAGLINHLWQDLTDSEKAEIKRILE